MECFILYIDIQRYNAEYVIGKGVVNKVSSVPEVINKGGSK